MGDALRYWEFFPADEPWGQIPVWRFAELVEPGDTALARGIQQVCARHRSPAAGRGTVTVIGLTSDRHVDHVAGLGVYDAVRPYDAVELLADDPAVFLAAEGQHRRR
jgi:hypothetical protein